MADSILGATALQLDASELRRLTKWPDPVIEEFLSLQRSISNVVNNINIVINNNSSISGDVNLTMAKTVALSKVVDTLSQEIASLAAQTTKTSSNKRDILRTVSNLQQIVQPLNALPSKVASQKRDLMRVIDGVKQEAAAIQGQVSWLRAQPVIESGGGASVTIITPSTSTTHTATESNNGGILVFNSASDCTLTLPQQSSEALSAGFYLMAKNIGGGNLILALQGSDTIDGVKVSQNPSQAITIVLQTAGSPNAWSLIGNDWLPTAVENDALTAPPATPAIGTVYIPASPATGSWTGKETQWAIHIGSDVYQFVIPPVGFVCYEKTSAVWIGYNATAWVNV